MMLTPKPIYLRPAVGIVGVLVVGVTDHPELAVLCIHISQPPYRL